MFGRFFNRRRGKEMTDEEKAKMTEESKALWAEIKKQREKRCCQLARNIYYISISDGQWITYIPVDYCPSCGKKIDGR
jgi:hypothetical protein